MRRLFDLDSPLMRFLSGVADLAVLNLLWLACCLPVVTIGPSCTALCYVARRIARRGAPPVAKTFFRAFRANFRQSLLVSLALLPPAGLAAGYLALAASGALDGALWLKALCCLVVLLAGFTCAYAFPLLAYFDNSVANTLKNAVLLPLANPLLALAVTALDLLPVLLLLFDPQLFARCVIFWVVLGAALTAVAAMALLERLFRRFALPGDSAGDGE